MKKCVIVLLMLMLFIFVPQVALAGTVRIGLPTMPAVPTIPPQVPTIPPEAPTIPPAISTEIPELPELPDDFEIPEFEDLIPLFLDYEYTLAERCFAPQSFTAAFYSPFLNGSGDAQLVFNDDGAITYSANYDLTDEAGNIWNHTSELDLTYDAQAFLDGKDTFISGSFCETSTLEEVVWSVSGTVSAQYVNFGDNAPFAQLANRDIIMLILHITDIQGWPALDFENLIYFLDPLEAFINQLPVENLNGIEDQVVQEIENTMDVVEENTRFPMPANSVQIAIGGSVTALLLAVSSIAVQGGGLGAAGMGAAAAAAQNTVQQAAHMGTTIQNAVVQAAPEGVPPAVEGIAGFAQSFKRFFVQLITNLRDMITDEGRSFADGKITEALEDINIPVEEE